MLPRSGRGRSGSARAWAASVRARAVAVERVWQVRRQQRSGVRDDVGSAGAAAASHRHSSTLAHGRRMATGALRAVQWCCCGRSAGSFAACSHHDTSPCARQRCGARRMGRTASPAARAPDGAVLGEGWRAEPAPAASNAAASCLWCDWAWVAGRCRAFYC
jgi:hypothetical protein